MQTDYDQLIQDACQQIDRNERHACRTSRACQEASGCPRCLAGLMKGDLGILNVEVFTTGAIRITTVGHDGSPCTVAFRNVPVSVRRG